MSRRAKRTLLVLPLVALLAAAWFFLRPGAHDHAGAAAAPTEIQLYTCGMHPAVIQNRPGNCPICGMKLTPIRKQPGIASTNARTSSASHKRKINFYKSTMLLGELVQELHKREDSLDHLMAKAEIIRRQTQAQLDACEAQKRACTSLEKNAR